MNRKYFYLLEQMFRKSLYSRNEKAQCEDCEEVDEEKEVITAKQPRGVKVHKVIVDDSCKDKYK